MIPMILPPQLQADQQVLIKAMCNFLLTHKAFHPHFSMNTAFFHKKSWVVTFKKNKATRKKTSQKSVPFPLNAPLQVVGYSSAGGSVSYNATLRQARAFFVAHGLRQKGYRVCSIRAAAPLDRHRPVNPNEQRVVVTRGGC